MRLPAVSVEVAAGIYTSNHTFQSPEARFLGNSASKVSHSIGSLRTFGVGRLLPCDHCHDCPCLSPLCAQEFSFYCPPHLRQVRGRVSRRALDSRSALPEFECQTPAAKRARLMHLATTRDVSKGAMPEDMVY